MKDVLEWLEDNQMTYLGPHRQENMSVYKRAYLMSTHPYEVEIVVCEEPLYGAGVIISNPIRNVNSQPYSNSNNFPKSDIKTQVSRFYFNDINAATFFKLRFG